MKTTFKRSQIYRSRTTGKYSAKRLNKNERESLRDKRDYLLGKYDVRCVDDYITPLYDSKSNEIYFIDESSYSNDERAIIITY